jgi:hypothetical protein
MRAYSLSLVLSTLSVAVAFAPHSSSRPAFASSSLMRMTEEAADHDTVDKYREGLSISRKDGKKVGSFICK